VGRTVGSVAEAVAAEQAGADFLVVEPVFSSTYAHGRTPLGPPTIRHIAGRVHVPVLASGGLTAGNAHQVIAAGAVGVSVISEIVDADNPEEAARVLMNAMHSAWEARPLMREALQ
jgi:thiamine monophosphate synthase